MTKALHFVAADAPDAQTALKVMRERYDDADVDKCDVIVALGGDGFMLQTLHTFLGRNKPIYGMNLGSVGFLMNEFREEALQDRLAAAESAKIHPLRMKHSTQGKDKRELTKDRPQIHHRRA